MDPNPNLEFRKIKSLDFLYEVSEDGRFLRNVKSKKYIKIFLDKHHSDNGYYAAFVNIKNRVIRVTIHKVVAECWLGERPNGYQVDHIDRNTRNNHYTNLRYVTHSDQMKNRKLSDHVIQQATKNCMEWVAKISRKTIVIQPNGQTKTFPSMQQAAAYLSIQTGTKTEHIRSKMKKRRKNIYGYDIIYLNAETGHAGPKGQGTVQESILLAQQIDSIMQKEQKRKTE